MSFLFNKQASATFRPKRNARDSSRHLKQLKITELTLATGDLRAAVRLPEGEDLSEWKALNIVDFYNQINVMYDTIRDRCTNTSCPTMSAGKGYEYMWADSTHKKPVKLSAPEYIDKLMNWIKDQIDDESIFPANIGVPFPKVFKQAANNIMKRMFRVYAHIYWHHADDVKQLQEDPHLNTSFKHFVFFAQEFDMIEKKELAPLKEIIEKFHTSTNS